MSPTQSLEVIGFSPEVTFGTFVAPTKFVPGTATINDSVTVTRPTQSRGTRSQMIDSPTQIAAGVQISAELTPEVLSSLIAGWFGVGSDTKTGSSGTGYTHTLTPQPSLPSYSIEVDNDIYSQILARQVVGNMVSQMVLTYQAGQITTAQFTTVAQRETTPATPGLPSNPTPAINTLQPMDFGLLVSTVGGTQSTQLTSATLTADNQVQAVYCANGARYAQRLQPTQRNVTFSTTLDFLDSSFYTYWSNLANSATGFVAAGGFVLTLTTAFNIPGASNPYKVQFTLPNLRPQDQYQISSASDVLQQQLTWSVTQGSAANEINAVIVNSESTALA